MNEAALIEDARRAGQAYIDSFHGDWKAIIADLNRRSISNGRQLLSLPPKPPRRPVVTAEK